MPSTLDSHLITQGQVNTALSGYLPKTAGASQALTDTLYGTDINMSGGGTFGDVVLKSGSTGSDMSINYKLTDSNDENQEKAPRRPRNNGQRRRNRQDRG